VLFIHEITKIDLYSCFEIGFKDFIDVELSTDLVK